MAEQKRRINAMGCSKTLQYLSIILLVSCVFMIFIEPAFVFFALYPAALLLALAGGLVRLFGVVQFFLSELLLLTFVVGAPCAAALAWIANERMNSRDRFPLLMLLALALQVVLHGITSGLWVAKALGITDLWERAGLMLLFAITPVLIAAAIILALAALVQPPMLFFALFVGLLAWLTRGACAKYRESAARMSLARQTR